MNTQLTNLFISNDTNRLIDSGHESYLLNRPRYNLKIAESHNGNNFPVEAYYGQSSFFINYLLHWKIENDVLKSFTRNNVKSETILIADPKSKANEMDLFGSGVIVFTGKEKIWKKIVGSFSKVINFPVRIMVDKFGINKYLSVFMLTSVLLGILADLILRFGI